MRRCLSLILVVSFLVAAGCADLQHARESLGKFTRADLVAALAIATDHNDLEAMQCYPVLIGLIDAKALHLTPVVGAVSAFEAARVRIEGLDKDVLRKVNLACAPLFTDASKTILSIAAKMGI